MSAASPMPRRALGRLDVPAVGFGSMVLAGVYAPVDDDTAAAALAAAVDAGCTFVDTSDSYGTSERQLARFHGRRRRQELCISTKFGLRAPDGAPTRVLPVPWIGRDLRVNAAPSLVREYLEQNNLRYAPVVELAHALGITPAQLALAWLLHQSDAVVPIPGSRRPAHVGENAAAAHVHLPPDALARLDAVLATFVPAGDVT